MLLNLTLNLTKCLIYLFSCRTLDKHYTGKTIDHFRYRWNNCKMEARKAESADVEMLNTSFYKATFCKVIKGFLEDVEVRMIDKTKGPDLNKRENYWMRTLRPFFSDGLNIERDY